VSLAFLNPWLAAAIAAVILIAGAFLVMFVLRKLRRLQQRYDEWGERNGLAPPRETPPRRGVDDTERLPERRP
jgi:hypothetical protein